MINNIGQFLDIKIEPLPRRILVKPGTPCWLFGQPLLASLPSECTQAELYSCLLARMGRYVSVPQEGEEWWKPPPKENGVGGEEMEVAGTPTIAGVATITPPYIKAQRLKLWSAIMIIANAHKYQFAEEK